MLRPTPVHAHFQQCLTDRVRVHLIRRPSLLMADFRQHSPRPQAAFIVMLTWRLADEPSQSLSGFIIVGSLIILACARLQFQTTGPFLIERMQHVPDLLITLPNMKSWLRILYCSIPKRANPSNCMVCCKCWMIVGLR